MLPLLAQVFVGPFLESRLPTWACVFEYLTVSKSTQIISGQKNWNLTNIRPSKTWD